MKSRLWLCALFLTAGLASPGLAQNVRTQVYSPVLQNGPASPVPVISPFAAPFTLNGAPQFAAPTLLTSLPIMPAPSVAPAAALSAAQTAAPQVSDPGQALATLSFAAQPAESPSRTQAAPAESISAQTGRIFDGERAPVQAQAQEAPPPDARPAAAASAVKPLRLIITGPPGSGKGTYSAKISQEYGIPHISVGELLRAYAKTHPAVANIMATGQLVDTKLVLEVVKKRLSQPDVKERGFILDGFPRRPVEARALADMLGSENKVDGIMVLDVPEAELLRRILKRGRADDSEPVFRDRMKIYQEQTVPAVEVFKKGAPVLAPEVSGSDIETNYAKVKAALLGLLDNLSGR